MSILKSIAALALILPLPLLVSSAWAGTTPCPNHFANGQSPDFINHKLTEKAREVCYSDFALKHSGLTRTPLYSAEHLTRERLSMAKQIRRSSTFYPDPYIPFSERAELRHYARSGYSRGHVAPSGDMPTLESQQESFTLANIVPQEASVNNGSWERIESATRSMAKERGELYIVTGPIYSGDTVQRIGGAVMVPTHMFKAIYDPKRNEAGAYLVGNTEGAQAQVISIRQLEALSGISVFPSISNQARDEVMKLPVPKVRKRRGGNNSEAERLQTVQE